MDALASSDALALASATVLCASVVGLIAVRAASNATGKDGTTTTASWFGALGRGRAPATAKETFDDAGKVRLSVFYGTQTGTSERYAREVVAHARARYGAAVAARAVDLETVDSMHAEDALVAETGCCVFLQSTYGDGEPTDTSSDFVYWARDCASDGRMPDLLENVTFSVFGLGNRCYEQFNAAAKMVHKALVDLGAQPLLKLHLGDDDQCLEQDFENWIEAFWPAFEAKFGLHSDGGDEELPRYDVIVMRGSDGERAAASQAAKYEKEHSNTRVAPTAAKPYLSSVKVVRELFSKDADRSCVHVEFDISGSKRAVQDGRPLGRVCGER